VKRLDAPPEGAADDGGLSATEREGGSDSDSSRGSSSSSDGGRSKVPHTSYCAYIHDHFHA
jgi:hypothetical protein